MDHRAFHNAPARDVGERPDDDGAGEEKSRPRPRLVASPGVRPRRTGAAIHCSRREATQPELRAGRRSYLSVAGEPAESRADAREADTRPDAYPHAVAGRHRRPD